MVLFNALLYFKCTETIEEDITNSLKSNCEFPPIAELSQEHDALLDEIAELKKLDQKYFFFFIFLLSLLV